MKKQLLNLGFVAVAFALYVASAVAAPIAPVNTMEVNAAWPTPVMDGIADDCYGDVQPTAIFNATGHEGDADFTAQFRVAWDPTYFYILAEITDDVKEIYNWGVGNSWEFDNIEFFFQLDTNTVTTAYGATTVQLRVDRELDSVESPGRAKRTDYLYYMEPDAAGGWITEVAIPWTAALATGAVPEDFEAYYEAVIGFDFSGADSDNTDGDETVGNRDVQSGWDSDDPDTEDDRTEDLAWNNTSVFGYITLAPYVAIDPLTQNSLNAYPNPATSEITFNVEGNAAIEIYSITGSLVMTANTAKVDISALNSGVYVAKANNKAVRFVVE